jgi:hypothetical protein
MAAFPTDATTEHPHDFALARGGGVSIYLSDEVLTASMGELSALGYAAAGLAAGGWSEVRLLHEDFASTLGFPDYYGHNMNALADCLQDLACGDYGWDTSRTGLAVTVSGFGPFFRQDEGFAHGLVDLLSATSGEAMLFGHRLLWLLHVDDADFRMGPVAAVRVPWNSREWLDSNRR